MSNETTPMSRDAYIQAMAISGNQLVDDKDKAHATALAGDTYRVGVMNAKRLGEIIVGMAVLSQDNDRIAAAVENAAEMEKSKQQLADQKEDEADKTYERDKTSE